MKKLLLLTVFTICCHWLMAQEIIAKHNDKGMYAAHTVSPKETFYSLGRMYSVPPKDIAAFNSLEMEKGLSVGQVVNIPLSAANFTQERAASYPVYYVVGEKEGLYRVSVNNNKVLMANLRKWNDLRSDAISAGQKLIVGYLISAPANMNNANKTVVPEKQDYAKMPEEKKEEVIVEEKPVQRQETVTEKKPDPKPVQTAVNDGHGGYFKPAFDMQVKAQPLKKDEVAAAGIFKTASGWQDAKYYALLDNVEPGTIVRVVNPNNNKAIYAKVLDKMTGIRQNQGYGIRISNAAATALDISETEKFFVRVNY